MSLLLDVLEEWNPNLWRRAKQVVVLTVALGISFHQQWAIGLVNDMASYIAHQAQHQIQPMLDHYIHPVPPGHHSPPAH